MESMMMKSISHTKNDQQPWRCGSSQTTSFLNVSVQFSPQLNTLPQSWASLACRWLPPSSSCSSTTTIPTEKRCPNGWVEFHHCNHLWPHFLLLSLAAGTSSVLFIGFGQNGDNLVSFSSRSCFVFVFKWLCVCCLSCRDASEILYYGYLVVNFVENWLYKSLVKNFDIRQTSPSSAQKTHLLCTPLLYGLRVLQ